MIPEKYNYIVVKLGDNDYGQTIKNALIEGIEWWGLEKNGCPIIWKKFIIAYIIGDLMKDNSIRGYYNPENETQNLTSIKKYLDECIKVTFEVNKPTEDHDGGHASYDLNLKCGWTF